MSVSGLGKAMDGAAGVYAKGVLASRRVESPAGRVGMDIGARILRNPIAFAVLTGVGIGAVTPAGVAESAVATTAGVVALRAKSPGVMTAAGVTAAVFGSHMLGIDVPVVPGV